MNGVTDFNYATKWEADGSDGDDLWIRTEIDLTEFDISTIHWDLGVDNGYKLYINGKLIASANAGCDSSCRSPSWRSRAILSLRLAC